MLNIGLIGPRGIGRVHTRLIAKAGHAISAVLSRTEESAKLAAEELLAQYNRPVAAYTDPESFFSADIDAVFICSPAASHFNYILSSFDLELPVFCEKPLFWDQDNSSDEMIKKLTVIREHPKRWLHINLCNVQFARAILQAHPDLEVKNTFTFRFHTHGRYRQKDIGADLLPHGLSVLSTFLGSQKITSVEEEIFDNNYRIHFCYGKTLVYFDLKEDVNTPKKLSIEIDGTCFERVQEGFGATYKVGLKWGETFLQTEDPFETKINHFLRCVQERSNEYDEFEEAELNLRQMAGILKESYG